MGFKKHRHSKDKLYIRSCEWEHEFGGYKKKNDPRQFKRLPYYSCCISLGNEIKEEYSHDNLHFQLLLTTQCATQKGAALSF